MSHLALYRQWRPSTFDDVVEQTHTVMALKQAVITGNIAHAYLFSGTRGTGKTTLAQIFSRAINCLSPRDGNPCNECDVCVAISSGTILDVIEMDAASNNNVDTIRRVCDEVVFAPTVAKYKVYIIDEVHMLSIGAFNALLKTLEEPPAHAVFILATTEPHKIPATILSRCQRYDFRRISLDAIVDRLDKISQAEGFSPDREAMTLIARLSDGALRDAISLLDQAKSGFGASFSKDDILSLVGSVNEDFLFELVKALYDEKPSVLFAKIEEASAQGLEMPRLLSDLLYFFRNLMIFMLTDSPDELLILSPAAHTNYEKLSSDLSLDYVLDTIGLLADLAEKIKTSLNPRISLEAGLLAAMPSLLSGSKSSPKAGEKSDSTESLVPRAAAKTQKSGVAGDPEIVSGAFPAGVHDMDALDNKTKKAEDTSEADRALLEQFSLPKNNFSSDPDKPRELTAELLQKGVFDYLAKNGQMTLILILRPAAFSHEEDKVTLTFNKRDTYNYNETNTEAAKRFILEALRSVANKPLELLLALES